MEDLSGLAVCLIGFSLRHFISRHVMSCHLMIIKEEKKRCSRKICIIIVNLDELPSYKRNNTSEKVKPAMALLAGTLTNQSTGKNT